MIYFLEDDSNIRNFVIYALNNSGFDVCGFDHPSKFWKAVNDELPELIILDIMLPEEDGIQILNKLRNDPVTSQLPVMMLTAKSTEYDKVIGLDSGADDYMTKPFGTMELLSRIKALLRRSKLKAEAETEYRIKDFYLNPSKHIVKVSGEEIKLTYKEFQLLCLLFESKGKVFSRDEILSRIWGYDFTGESRTVDVHIRTLRAKLKSAGDMIQTVRGIGYKVGGGND